MAARVRAGPLAMEQLPVRGDVLTASASHQITDSGAAATALAAGVATFNGAIGVGPDTVALETVLEAAEARGMATGLVATSSVTHATPAAFAAHVPNRSAEYEIARQMASSGVDVLLGGGRRYFRPASRPDDADLVAAFRSRGCASIEEAAGLDPIVFSDVECLVGLFAEDGMPRVTTGRTPSLPHMATAALAIVQRDPDGFFLMIEGSQIDWAGHANDGEWNVAETLDFDATVGAVLRALGNRPNTTIIVTADHETGGLSSEPGALAFHWKTKGHTNAPVPLYAAFSSAQSFAGPHTLAEVGQLLLRLVRGR
jgi:alkaline phosphatase